MKVKSNLCGNKRTGVLTQILNEVGIPVEQFDEVEADPKTTG
jgi:hypothetical protein